MLDRTIGAGARPATAGRAALAGTATILAGATFTSPIVQVIGLPYQAIWLTQTAGVLIASATLQFTATGSTGGVQVDDLWFDYPPGTFVLPPLNIPILSNIEFPALAIRIVIVAAANDTTVQFALGGHA